ncbi:AAA family ATPase [Halopenitus persicus]|uniref:DNA repair exonuclease SbcCD ATPase subunit n=1 Tax=Halopenitus persicus TaxID=1048396 RepID=A0A1H3LET9_9EURY|nr:AAA family ATPase [Halopenitus persicus]SDY62901.1 DNA repair exonuclease SbcCD ATPase subunit [Halopenitus persicus]
MNFETLTLSNFQSYDELEIEFGEGLTLIYGPNGAGKSTIARALYTTLYPYRGRNRIGAHELVDLIQDGKNSASSELIFSVGDERYQITVDIDRKSDGGARASAEMTTLGTGETYCEKSTEIEEKVTQLLGMNYEAFANSTYAQQTELNRLIEASPGDREEILDNLLGLTAPDDYEEDINEVSKSVEDWLEDKRSRLSTVRDDIEEFEADDPKATLQTKTEKIEDLEGRIEELEGGIEEARERLRDIEDDIDEHRERRSELDDLTSQRDEVESTIDDLQSDIEELEEKIRLCDEDIEEHRSRIADFDDEVDDFDLTDEQAAHEAVGHYEDEYDDVNSTVEQKRASVESAEDEVERLEDELGDLRDELDDAESRRESREAEVEDAEQALEDAETILDERRTERDEVLRDYLDATLDDVDDPEEAVRDRMDDLRGEKSDLQTERETKRDRRSRLADEISDAEDELTDARERRKDIRQSLEGDVDDPEKAFEAAVERADEAASTLGFSVTAEDIDTVFTGRLPEQLEGALDDHRSAAEDLADAREMVGRTTARVDDLRSLAEGEWPLDGGEIGVAHDYGDHIDRLEAEQSEARSAADTAGDDLDNAKVHLDRVQAVAEALFEAASFRALADVATEIAELEATIDSTREERADLKAKIEALTEEIDGLEDEIEAGDSALDDIEGVEDAAEEVEEAERELEDAREELTDVEDEIAGLESDITDKRTELDEARDAVEAAEVALAAAEDELASVESARDVAREARDAHNEIETLESDREGYRDRRDDKREQIESEHDDLQEIESEIEELEKELGDTTEEELQERKEEIEGVVDDLEGQLETARGKRDDARDAKTKAEDRLDRLRDKRDQKTDLEEKIQWAKSILDDFEAITDTYDEVQTRMRERVLDRLKHHTNKVFRDLYQNSTYEAVDIDEDYDLRLVSGSDTARDPHKASGGEGVLVTIALRAGVYRVLADQAEGRDDRLPPFILDEPTNHLDESHIDQLEEAVDSIRDWNVPQVFVVDRYEGLVQDADHRIHVEMDDGDGGSKVETDPEVGDGPESAEAGGD